MENKTPTAVHTLIDRPSHVKYDAAGNDTWATGAFKRMPWLALASIVGVLACLIGLIALINKSAGSEVESWPLQPSVFIAIIIALLNPLLSLALSEGATIFWWRRALRSRCTVEDLHNNWQHGQSLWYSATAGRKITLLAVAFLLCAIVPLNGPLSQRASHVVVAQVTSGRTLLLDAASDLPDGYTGYFSGRARTPGLLSADFLGVVQRFANSTPIASTGSRCRGTCSGATLNGVGFYVECNSTEISYKLYDVNADGSTNDDTFTGVNVFETGFSWEDFSPSNLSLYVTYKDSPDDEGVLQGRNCSLALANVDYPIVIDGNNSVISLDPSTTIFDDTFVRLAPVNDNVGTESSPTTLGGAALALNNQFGSWAHLRFVGAWGFEVQSAGSMSARYVDPSSIGSANNYTIVWTDPTADLLAATRELMFRTAIAAANGTNLQQPRATETRTTLIYETRYVYMVAATGLTLLSLVVLLPMFFGYWSLGRQVSMSPVEIGKAFGARILDTRSSNDSAEDIVSAIGEKGISYGITEQGKLQILTKSDVRRPLTGSKIA